jgi:hypothetical protein
MVYDTMGIFRKKNAAGGNVLRDRTKAGLWGLGGVALFTPIGGSLISSAAGNAATNVTKTTDGIVRGVADNTSSQLSSSSSSLLMVLLLLGSVGAFFHFK